jgi:hypothetical protein
MSDSDSKKYPNKSINVPIELYPVEGINVNCKWKRNRQRSKEK